MAAADVRNRRTELAVPAHTLGRGLDMRTGIEDSIPLTDERQAIDSAVLAGFITIEQTVTTLTWEDGPLRARSSVG